ncbi:MAG TPA: hypothetical protein VMU57_18840 [Edaphobacter sp.]|uniref:hypothetical protein n=1 Tax=Edaphobacter sp. TaxID=1934404 RepID=UPI002CF8CC3E|nr:hypothetical protein [Edaphobacter sp.]HUZ96966.1 hypothetical protein [Edaphobacter sp.]
MRPLHAVSVFDEAEWRSQPKRAEWQIFDSLQDLSSKLAATGYFIDPVMIHVVFLASKLQKPLLLEGPAGSGKTQLALSVAAAGRTHVERLQCYRGVTEDKATDGDRNQTKSMLDALFRSVPDVSMRFQFRYEISEHLGDLLASYIHEQRTEQSEVMALDAHRLRMWRQKESGGFYFENRLHVYFIWDPRTNAKLYHSTQQNRSLGGITLSQKKAIQRTRKEHETYLAEFESILRGIEGSMEAASLGPRRLFTQELFEELKHAQHPNVLAWEISRRASAW